MSNAGRLAKQAFALKPQGTETPNFRLPNWQLQQISEQVEQDATDAAYAATISYTEAFRGLSKGRSSWSIVKLYYSAFYCIRGLCLLNNIVPFHSYREHYLLDLTANTVLKGGKSSHHWNWSSFRKIKRLHHWYYSQDSEDTYNSLRDKREDANYKFAFIDPEFPSYINKSDGDLPKMFRTYRDDKDFFYTYLQDHGSLAYPTALVFSLDREINARNITFTDERRKYIKSIWPLKDRCPMSRQTLPSI
jgi:hypothetical protein